MDTTYSGTCFCGTVKLAATGTPAAMGYCHCESCRHWSAGPVNAFTLWDPVNYVDTVLPMKDGLAKFRGFPKEVGGTGEMMAE